MKKYQTHIILTIIFCMMAFAANARRMSPRDAFSDSVMCLVFKYSQSVDTTGRAEHKSYAYTKFQIKTNKRNATLMLVPTMYAVAHGGGRRFISEFYNQMTLDANGRPVAKRLLNISTIPHRSNTLSSVLKYMTPTVYGETLFETNILSPFHYKNRRYYKYAVTQLPGAGFRVVISSFFADIHKNNELNNLVLPVVVSEEFLKELFESIDKDHKTEVKVDLPNQTVTNLATGKSEHFEINGYKKHCLENGLDDVDFLVQNRDKVEAWEAKNK